MSKKPQGTEVKLSKELKKRFGETMLPVMAHDHRLREMDFFESILRFVDENTFNLDGKPDAEHIRRYQNEPFFHAFVDNLTHILSSLSFTGRDVAGAFKIAKQLQRERERRVEEPSLHRGGTP